VSEKNYLSVIVSKRLLIVFSMQGIERDMVVQVQRFEDLYETGQQIVQVVNNDDAVRTISLDLEAFQERWKQLVENMEAQSRKVGVRSMI